MIGRRDDFRALSVLALVALLGLSATALSGVSGSAVPSEGAHVAASFVARPSAPLRSGGRGVVPPLASPLTADGGWEQITPTQDCGGLTYDPALSGVVLYGDCDDVKNFSGATWLFSNGSWNVIPPLTGGPPEKYEPGLVYDPLLGGVLLFGGAYLGAGGTSLTASNATWLLANGTWTQLAPSRAPPAREAPQLVWDAAQQEVVLFGGEGAIGGGARGPLNDSWTFANGTWSASAAGPSSAGMYWDASTENFAYDPSLNASVLVTSNQTWLWTAGVWSQLSTATMPLNHLGANLAYDAATGALLLVGGCCNRSGAPFTDVWSFDNGSWNQTLSSGTPVPGGYASPTLAFDPLLNATVYYAGSGLLSGRQPPDASTWLLTNGSWSPVLRTSNAYQRFAGGFAYDPAAGADLLFGGWTYGLYQPSSYNMDDTWVYENETWSRLNLSTEPAGRAAPSMAYDPADRSVVLFGGASYSGGPYSDTWNFSNGSWQQLTPSTHPSARLGAAMAYDAADGYLLLFGGEGTGGVRLGDTWSFDNGTWTNLTRNLTRSPPARAGAAMVYDAQLGQIVLFGGGDAAGELNDTWTYSGGVWTNITARAGDAPTPRDSPAFAYDPLSGDAVLTGGGNWFSGTNGFYGPGGSYGGTWLFVNGSWLPQSDLSTILDAVANPQSTYDASVGAVIVYGGDGAPASTWFWTGPEPLGSAVLQLNPSVTEVGQTTRLTVQAVGGSGKYEYAWSGLPPGCTGRNTATLSCAPASAGTFPVAVNITDPVANESVTAGPENLTVVPELANATLAVSPSAVDPGGSLRFWANASGGETPYSYRWTGLPAGCAGSNASTVTCVVTTPSNSSVVVNISDPLGGHVAAGPILVDVAANLTATFQITPTVIDADRSANVTAQLGGGLAPYRYLWSGVPAACTAGNVSAWACAPGATGTFNISLEASDAGGQHLALGPIALRVVPTLAIGSFEVNPSSVDSGQSLHFVANLTGGVRPFRIDYSNLPDGCGTVNATFLNCTASTPGTFDVGFSVVDAMGDRASASLNLTVAPPLSVGPYSASPALLDVGQTTTLSAPATGGTPPLTWTFGGLPTGCASSDQPTITCTPLEPGRFPVSVQVSDATGASLNGTLQFTVDGALRVSGIDAPVGPLVAGFIVTVNANVSGGTGPFNVNWSGLWPGCTPGAGLAFSCSLTTLGSFNVTARVTDATGETGSANTTLVVAPPPFVFASFTATPSPVSVGTNVTLRDHLKGGWGALTIAYTGLPPGCVSENLTVWGCTPSTAGVYNITAHASDTAGQYLNDSLTLTVTGSSSTGPPTGPSGHSGSSSLGLWISLAVVGAAVVLVAVLAVRRQRPPARTGPAESATDPETAPTESASPPT